ncbi:MAG: RNA polymerase sigma factor RpoE [Legionellales bacterium]|nr:RNA polymerase sigma factor RpoE [Legionellales bacterium]
MNKKNKQEAQDLELVEKAQAGDETAFAQLVNTYNLRVMKIISRYVHDYNEIQDLAQDTFIKAFNGLNQFRGDCKFYTWLYRVAINTAKNYVIKQGHTVPTVDVTFDEQDHAGLQSLMKELATPEHELMSEELQDAIYVALDELSDELKVTLMLYEIEGLSYEDIADVLDCPVGTVRSRIFRAREIIKLSLTGNQ